MGLNTSISFQPTRPAGAFAEHFDVMQANNEECKKDKSEAELTKLAELTNLTHGVIFVYYYNNT